MSLRMWSDQIAVLELYDEDRIVASFDSFDLASVKHVHVLVDFTSITSINSSHLSRLLKMRKQAIENDKRIVLCNVPAAVWQTFMVTGLDNVFAFAATVNEGAIALGKAR